MYIRHLNKTFPAFIIILLVCFSAAPSAHAEFPDSADIALINEGLRLILNEDYSHAEELFSEFRMKYPGHPCGPFFIAATRQAQMKDHEDFAYEREFYDNIDSAIDLADKLRNHDSENAWAYYFMGAANLYHALYDSRKGGKWSPLRNGIRGKNLLEKCLGLDSTLYDALAGLGSYRYWGEVKAGGFKWLPFIGGNRKQGIDNLIAASQKSYFSQDLSKSALIYVYIEEEEYSLADSLAAYLHSKYPEGKTFLWARAFANFEGKNYEKALEFFDSLENRLEKQGPSENYNLYEIAYYKMLCRHELKQYDLALVAYDCAQNLPLTEDERERLNNECKGMEKCRENILEILGGK